MSLSLSLLEHLFLRLPLLPLSVTSSLRPPLATISPNKVNPRPPLTTVSPSDAQAQATAGPRLTRCGLWDLRRFCSGFAVKSLQHGFAMGFCREGYGVVVAMELWFCRLCWLLWLLWICCDLPWWLLWFLPSFCRRWFCRFLLWVQQWWGCRVLMVVVWGFGFFTAMTERLREREREREREEERQKWEEREILLLQIYIYIYIIKIYYFNVLDRNIKFRKLDMM